MEAIHSLADAYGSVGKTVCLRRLSPDCAKLLAKMYQSGKLPPYEIIESDPNTDPEYGLAVNYSGKRGLGEDTAVVPQPAS